MLSNIQSACSAATLSWLAQVGADRLDEIENPELATQRTRELYKLKGYSPQLYPAKFLPGSSGIKLLKRDISLLSEHL